MDPTGQQPLFPEGTKPQDVLGALQGLGQAFIDPATITGQMVQALKAPGNALKSTSPITTEEMIKPAADLAGMAMTGGVPAAEKGALGIFGGRLAQSADLNALNKAQKMDLIGHPRSEIWDQTGWFKGADGKWRFEIPDRNATINSSLPEAERATDLSEEGVAPELQHGTWVAGGGPTDNDLRAIPRDDTFLLPEVLKHPELYESYPHLKNVVVDSAFGMGGDVKGVFHPPDPGGPVGIGLGDSSLLGMRSAALHELQHAVQEREGFLRGSNPSKFVGVSPAEAHFRYAKEPGEMEARNVQLRADMTPAQRLAVPPWESERWVHPSVNTSLLVNRLRGY